MCQWMTRCVQSFSGLGWDVTTVPISADEGHLSNGQTSALARTKTTGGSFVPTLVPLPLPELVASSPPCENTDGAESADTYGEGCCACTAPGGSGHPPWSLLGVGLGLYVARRRKRRSALSQL